MQEPISPQLNPKKPFPRPTPSITLARGQLESLITRAARSFGVMVIPNLFALLTVKPSTLLPLDHALGVILARGGCDQLPRPVAMMIFDSDRSFAALPVLFPSCCCWFTG